MSESSSLRKQTSSGIRVRDMVRRYDTAIKTDSARFSYSSIGSTKSSYFGINANANANQPIPDEDEFDALFAEENRPLPQSPSRSSSGSQKTVRRPRSPCFETFNQGQSGQLDNQNSFMDLSRSRDRIQPQPKRVRHSMSIDKIETTHPYLVEDKINVPDASYQSKTTISKTPKGVRIIVDIYFDQNKGIAVEDVIGSRIETDIPPSKILKEFQKRVSEISQD